MIFVKIFLIYISGVFFNSLLMKKSIVFKNLLLICVGEPRDGLQDKKFSESNKEFLFFFTFFSYMTIFFAIMGFLQYIFSNNIYEIFKVFVFKGKK